MSRSTSRPRQQKRWSCTACCREDKILVIKHGSVGDFFQSIPFFESIRREYRCGKITLLTTKVFEDFAKKMPYFDNIIIDNRDGVGWPIINQMINEQYDITYDLQLSERTRLYSLTKFITWKKWVGDYYSTNKPVHSFERRKSLLDANHLYVATSPSLKWLPDGFPDFMMQLVSDDGNMKSYALIVPQASRVQKKWPLKNYIDLCQELIRMKITPVIIGANSEIESLIEITNIPCVINAVGKTDFVDLLLLGKKALISIGNDTGPMHAFAMAGSPSIVLFSKETNPEKSSPVGDVISIRRTKLSDLQTNEVLEEVNYMINKTKSPKQHDFFPAIEVS